MVACSPQSRHICYLVSGGRAGTHEGTEMQMIQSGYRGLSLVLELSLGRILIPAAIVVGLAGGAMIGAEVAKLQIPQSDFMR